MLKVCYEKLNIPFDKSFYQLPIEHYTTLSEKIGVNEVIRYIRELLIEYKLDIFKSNKARILLNKLQSKILLESIADIECECGFNSLGEEYEKCPMCGKLFHTEDICYYKNEDDSCSIDGDDCQWNSYHECGKLTS